MDKKDDKLSFREKLSVYLSYFNGDKKDDKLSSREKLSVYLSDFNGVIFFVGGILCKELSFIVGSVILFSISGLLFEILNTSKRLKEIEKKLCEPHEHEYTATTLNNLAALYREQGKYAEAEPLFKRSLAILEKDLGHEHPNLATSLNNLAELYKNQGKYAEAEPLCKQSLAIREKVLGSEHPKVATSLHNLSKFYYDQKKYTEAESLLKRAYEIRLKKLGPDHPSTKNSQLGLELLKEKLG